MKILVTGGTGFLGLNIKEHLQKHMDAEIECIGSRLYDLRYQVSCHLAITETRPDVIVHAAGTVGGISANAENPGKFMYENLIMGANIIEASRIREVGKVIMLGTVCSYPKHTSVPFVEEDLWDGYPEETNAPYGIAKKTLMKLGEVYNEQYGMNVTNLIPVNMYGPYDHFNLTSSHVIPALILKFHSAIKGGKREVELWGTGNASREFLFAPDCVEAIALAIQGDAGPEPMNIGNGEEVSIMDLAAEIAEQMGFDGDMHFDSSKPDGQPRRCLNVDRARKQLGFEAKTYWKDGLKTTIEWFLNEQRKNKENKV